MATDVTGATGVPEVALSVPDYFFVNDFGLGFGGTNAEVFDVGESALLTFPSPLRNISAQHDLIIYAFVGGLGATDNATVQVEASSDGTNFEVIATFDTQEARNREQDRWENDFEAVKHFFVEFGSADNVTHIRLTNLAGTSEGLRLDAVEGLHPDVSSSHAFEMRLERSREDSWKQFKLRIKNIGDPAGVPIREIKVITPTNSSGRLENTDLIVESIAGDFICVENCLSNNPGNAPIIPFSRHAWSIDGLVEAPAGFGLDPGQAAAHSPAVGMDTDTNDPYLSGYSFEVTFADGFAHAFDYDLDVEKEIGSLYEKYLYFSSTPVLSWNRPVDFYEFAAPEPSFGLLLLFGASGLANLARMRRRVRIS